MARGVNEVTIIGNLGNDPEVRYSQSGACVTTISVATSESWKDKSGEQQERTEWHRIKFFGRLAEIVGEYLKKGRQIYVKGKLRYGSYEKDGVTHYTTDIIGEEMQILGGGGDRGDRGGGDEAGQRRQHREQQQGKARESGQQRQAPSYGPPGRDAHQRSDDPFDDSDIPF